MITYHQGARPGSDATINRLDMTKNDTYNSWVISPTHSVVNKILLRDFSSHLVIIAANEDPGSDGLSHSCSSCLANKRLRRRKGRCLDPCFYHMSMSE